MLDMNIKSTNRFIVRVALFLAIATAAFHLPAAEPPKVGAPTPDFTLNTMDAKSVTLSAEYAKLPVVLIVLRGWPGYQCPFCTRQVHAFVERAKDFAGKARVLMVYPGPSENLQSHAGEFLKGKGWSEDFTFVTDPDFTFTKSFGLRWQAPGETAYPSTFVIDTKGIVQFEKITKGHGGRTTPEEILAALAKL